MERVIVRRIGVTSLYMRIPYEWARAINLTHNDLAYLVPVEGKALSKPNPLSRTPFA
jgi:hypothetical protein